jgi:hypothetical protein
MARHVHRVSALDLIPVAEELDDDVRSLSYITRPCPEAEWKNTKNIQILPEQNPARGLDPIELLIFLDSQGDQWKRFHSARIYPASRYRFACSLEHATSPVKMKMHIRIAVGFEINLSLSRSFFELSADRESWVSADITI